VTNPSLTMAMQPKTGIWGVHFPSTCSFCRLMTRSRWAGVRAARHKPSHSPVSAQTRPASCVGILQIGFGNSPAGSQRPPACSQPSCVRGISNCDPHNLDGIACCGSLTASHVSPEQVQYPAAWAKDALPAQSNITNTIHKLAAGSGRFPNFPFGPSCLMREPGSFRRPSTSLKIEMSRVHPLETSCHDYGCFLLILVKAFLSPVCYPFLLEERAMLAKRIIWFR